MAYRIVIFLILNFGALGAGFLFISQGVPSEWYANLSKAPWTPPGWFFGFAWTSIMICFSIYMAVLWNKIANRKQLISLFVLQWVLNVIWNPLFFYFHFPLISLFAIVLLTLLMGFFLFNYKTTLKAYSIFVLPYFLWLVVATSLNAYILFNN